MYPAIAPFASGLLPVSDGNLIYWEASGNPQGKPALFLHGGPGGGMGAGYRRRFDPERYLIVGFEQRGCGRSRPRVTDDLSSLATNTTQKLMEDIELLREHLGVERWLLNGLSWGSTLALAYAQAHPECVTEIVLFAVTTTTAEYVEWITERVGCLFPEEWELFARASRAAPGQRLVDAYYELLTSPDPATRAAAAAAWCAWEDAHISLCPQGQPTAISSDPVVQQTFATLVCHYWKHASFLPERALLENIPRIRHLPGILIHGRFDVSSPLRTAWQLHQAWPNSQLIVIEDEGHGGTKMIEALIRANDGFAVH